MTVSEEIKSTLGFDPNHADLLQLLKDSAPPLGIEECSNLFRKFGHTLSGMQEGWEWNPQITVSEAEAWKMIAISALYWENKYKKWYHEEVDSKLNQNKV